MTPSWHDDARCIPLWDGCTIYIAPNGYGWIRMCDDGEGRVEIVAERPDGEDWFEDREFKRREQLPDGGIVELTQPDTFRGAVARLALRLGATADAEGAA